MRSDLLLGASALRLPARTALVVLAVTVLALAALLMAAKPAQAATFAVTKTDDTNDGVCDADCSLREAIIAANNAPGPDTISVPAGAYTLTIAGEGEDAAATGDLDVTHDLTITGAGAQSTTIDANSIERAFEAQQGAKLTISKVTIKGGNAGGGGGILVRENGANLTLNDSVITGNKAQLGGGLDVFDGSAATLNNDTISNNTATTAGGGIYSVGTLTVTNSTINNNITGGAGGGLESDGGVVTLTNDTFSGNTAGSSGGGGILGLSTALTLTNVTINKNTINAGSGGGVRLVGGSTAKFKNSIVANSTGGTECSTLGGTLTLTSLGNNLSSDASCNFTASGDIQNQDPKLGPLQANGGPTSTHALLTGSPAIDAGSSTGCPSADQRGVARPQDGDNDGSALCDIGAFELAAQGSPPPPPGGGPPPPGGGPPLSGGPLPSGKPLPSSGPPPSGGSGGGHHHKVHHKVHHHKVHHHK